MLKMAKEEALNLDDEPRSIRDTVKFNRLRIMIEEEAIKPTWGCPLYIAARPKSAGGWLDPDQRMAGDKYQQAHMDYIQAQASDPREAPDRELAYRRVHKRKRLWKEATEALYGTRHIVDRFILEEIPAVTQRERLAVKDGLTLLVNFFGLRGNKR
jgi:hypothetical protein